MGSSIRQLFQELHERFVDRRSGVARPVSGTRFIGENDWRTEVPVKNGRHWMTTWWRRRESNPRPQVLHSQDYMLSLVVWISLRARRPAG